MIREALSRIGHSYRAAAREPISGHTLAQFLRHGAAEAVAESLGDHDFQVHGSPGQGQWAEVPWIAIFDPIITTAATRGYYVVYLFSANMARVYLSLNQGTTTVREEFGPRTDDELSRRARLMRSRIPEFEERFPEITIDLASSRQLPRDYEDGHACGISYALNQLPYEELLANDLRTLLVGPP